MHPNAKKRHEILGHLYDQREAKAKAGWVNEYELKSAFGEVAFALAVLAELGHIRADGPKYRIVGPGVLACEAAQEE